jgi:hypothetical protein
MRGDASERQLRLIELDRSAQLGHRDALTLLEPVGEPGDRAAQRVARDRIRSTAIAHGTWV